jgi:hypothetical protein
MEMAQHSALPSSAAVNPARVIVCPEASDVQEFEECVLSTNFRVLTTGTLKTFWTGNIYFLMAGPL